MMLKSARLSRPTRNASAYSKAWNRARKPSGSIMIRGQAAAAPDCWKSLTNRSRSMRAAFVETPDADVRIDHHDGFDMRGQPLEQAAQRAGLAAIDCRRRSIASPPGAAAARCCPSSRR